MIKITNLYKTFKTYEKEPGFKGTLLSFFKRKYIEKHALKNINFEIQRGEIVGLIGSNGAGKTTLSKIMSGIIHPSQGTASVYGHIPVERQRIFLKKLSLVMGQKANLWWDLPAMDSFILLKEIYEISDQDFYERLNELKTILEIDRELITPLRKLSLGERMKAEIIGALLHRPEVLFLDEPTIGLDITTQKRIREFLKNYHAKYQPTIIITSHYMEDIKELCQRLIILRKGEMVFDGKIDSLIQKYDQLKQITIHTLEETIVQKIEKQKIGEFISQLINKGTDIVDISIDGIDIEDIIEDTMRGIK